MSDAMVDTEKYKWRVAAAAFLGYTFDGVDFMVLSLVLPFIIKEWGITLAQGGVIATATLFGACLGGYIFGPIADKFGRKKSMIACITFFSITTGLCGFAQDYVQLAIIRFISGLGLGAQWALGATMLAEFFPPHQRGKASSSMQMGWPVGYAIAICFQLFLVPAFGWRALFFAGVSAFLVAVYVMFFVPESPVWLKARENKRLGIKSQTQTAAQAIKWTELFKGKNFKVTLLATALCACALTTYWLFGTWLPTLLAKERGLSLKAMAGYLMWVNVWSVGGYIVGGWLGDKISRRILIGTTSIVTGIITYFWMGSSDQTVFFCLGMATYFVGSAFWATMSAFVSEQFSTTTRAFAVSFSFGTGRLVAAVFPFIVGAIAAQITLSSAIALVVFIYALGGIIAFMMNDTKGTVVVD
jgi:MFS family permease